MLKNMIHNRTTGHRRAIQLGVALASVAALATLSGGAFAAEQGASAGLPQFDPSTYPSQLFWLVVTFMILFLFFTNKSLPEISSVLENRRNHIEGDLETAQKLQEEAETAQKAYEDSLSRARAESSTIMAAAQENIKSIEAAETKAFSEKSEHEAQALEVRLTKAKQEAMEDMSTIAAEVAREAAEKIVGISADIKQAQNVVKTLRGKQAA